MWACTDGLLSPKGTCRNLSRRLNDRSQASRGRGLPGIRQKINPSRRERCDSIAPEIRKLEPSCNCYRAWSQETKSGSSNVYRQNTSRALESYRALRDGSFLHIIPGNPAAAGCLATIIQSLRDGLLFGHIPAPKAFEAGYDHSIPSGQQTVITVHVIDSTSTPQNIFEDEDDDDDEDEDEAPHEHIPVGPHKAFLI